MDDNASKTGQTPGSASTGDILLHPFVEVLGEIYERKRAQAWLQEYARLFDAPPAASPPPIPAADATEDLKVEFFARGLPLQSD